MMIRFQKLLSILFLIPITLSFSQSTYFFKFKNDISNKIIDKEIDSIKDIDNTLIVNNNRFNIKQITSNTSIKSSILERLYKINIPEDSKEKFLKKLRNNQNVEYIQKSNIYKVDAEQNLTNDSLYSRQWGLKKVGIEGAWDVTEGSKEISIGLIDTGIDYFHPELSNKMKINPAEDLNDNGKLDESDKDGIDNDGNGFIDDVIGWDFTDRVGFPFDTTSGDYLAWDNNPMDEYGHGTYVAGVLGAEKNNEKGIAGVAPNCKILNLRAFDPSGYGEEDDVAAAILYAIDNDADIINMSFGDNSFSYVLRDIIKYADFQGIIMVASAGNSGSNQPHYPSGYSEVISVGASTQKDYVASFSNYGSTLDLVAPGSNIITTEMEGEYTSINGTSASAPFVSGTAAMLLSLDNSLSGSEIKQILKSTSTDINETGWDERSGAGRLNSEKALTIPAPAIVEFNHPKQDYAAAKGEIDINVTALSPYFESFDIDLGEGLNPEDWTNLIAEHPYQISNEKITTLPVNNLVDTSYTLRIKLHQTNGRVLEERVNFHIQREKPEAVVVNFGEALYGKKSTIFASVYSKEKSIVKMYYRRKGEQDFNFISLDGFATNNQFVKQAHYGFIPKKLITPKAEYEMYFEAIDLVGNTLTLTDSGEYYNIKLQTEFTPKKHQYLKNELPPGRIFKKPVNFTSKNLNEILINTNLTPKYTTIYKYASDDFIKVDSIKKRLPKDFGDFNKNGKKELLSLFIRNGYLDEQKAVNSTEFNNIFSDTSGAFWPIKAKDMDKDGNIEILSIKNDTTLSIWEYNGANNGLTLETELENFSEAGLFGNIFDAPNAVVEDITGDQRNEICIVDRDGDIIIYRADGSDKYSNKGFIKTDFIGISNNITSGDFNGDGRKELSVLLESTEELDIAPFNLLLIFNHELNLAYSNAVIDPSSEFGASFQKTESTLKFENLDDDTADELILFSFPYAYVLDDLNNPNSVLFYEENVNSNQIFTGDVNGNGVTEISIPKLNSTKFVEINKVNDFNISKLTGYSLDSTRIRLEWNEIPNSDFYYIFRASNDKDFHLIDSTEDNFYIDSPVKNDKHYYYSVSNKIVAEHSSLIEVYSHAPAVPISAISNNSKNVLVKFSAKIKTTVNNLEAFSIDNVEIPNSVAPNNQFSYLLNFESPLPEGKHNLTVKNLSDYYNSPIEKKTLEFSVISDSSKEKFFIRSYEVTGRYSLKVSFNKEYKPEITLTKANYKFEPVNSVNELAQIDNHTVSIKTKNPIKSVGIEYRLKISNLVSSDNSGNIELEQGAGSSIVISSFSEDLSNVYTYPNPVKSSGNVTFANLTKRAEINIFSLNGKKITSLTEDDGNGGLTWDLRDDSGTKLASGVYIYRIQKIDNFNNKSGEKIGKFVVIR